MIKIISLSTVILLHLASFSQQQTRKGVLSVSIAAALPTGNFSNDRIQDDNAGIAKLGQAAQISYSRLLGKRFGFAASLQGQRNPIAIKSMEKQFAESNLSPNLWMGAGNGQPIGPAPVITYPGWNFEKSSWLLASLMLGGYGEFPFSEDENIAFTTKAMLGPVYAKTPKLKGSSITDSAAASFETNSKSAFGLRYVLSGGLKINSGKRCSFLFNLEYAGTNKIKFKNLSATTTTVRGQPGLPGFTAVQSMRTADGYQTISSLNLAAGIGIRL